MRPELKCPTCPMCGAWPGMAIFPWQVMCSNEDCEVFCWDMTVSASVNLSDRGSVTETSTQAPPAAAANRQPPRTSS